ncbi:ParB/RepB/Spo0J family partition protein [Chloroflexota bacterium]
MKTVDLPIDALQEAPWNPNVMDADVRRRLQESLERFGLVQNLVVRPLDNGIYEVLSGSQRLKALREQGITTALCVVVVVDDANARLLSQALNHIHGEDDLGLRAELLRQVLKKIPEAQVLSLLPETVQSLASLAELGSEDLVAHLQAWEEAQAARLRHLTIHLSNDQLGIVEQALERAASYVTQESDNPNKRGNAMFQLCKRYLEMQP